MAMTVYAAVERSAVPVTFRKFRRVRSSDVWRLSLSSRFSCTLFFSSFIFNYPIRK
jgi:hypothetical protein